MRQTPRRDIFDFGFDSQWRRQGVWKRCRTNTGPNEHLEGNRNVAKNATRAVECFWGGGLVRGVRACAGSFEVHCALKPSALSYARYSL